MATKYPTDYDDGTTLGPTFIDAAPPTDPQRNIAAEFRNNERDAIIAVQTKVGKTDDTSTTSMDWGLLSVSGAPNQGLRFAGSHATFPGVTGEDGIFIDSASGNVSFHKSGDPVGTFTDLTSGGGASTWDALYAADKTLTIDTTALIWTQTSGTGYGFQFLRTSNSTSPMMQVHNQHATNTQACLELNVASSSSPFIQANYDFGGSGDEFAVDYAGNVSLKGALQRVVDGNLTVSTSNGDVILDADATTNDNIIANVGSSGTFRINAGGTNTGFLDVNVSSWDLSGNAACYFATTGAMNFNADGGYSFTGDTVQMTAVTNDDALIVNQGSTGSILNLQDGGVPRVDVAETGNVAFTPLNPTSTFSTQSITLTSGGVGSATIKAIDVSLTGEDAGDSNAFGYGIGLGYTDGGGGGSMTSRGVNIDSGWDFGIYSNATCYLTDGVATAAAAALIKPIPLLIDSDPGSFLSASIICNAATNKSTFMLMSEGTVDNLTTTNTTRFTFFNDGQFLINCDSAGSALNVAQTNASGTEPIFNLDGSGNTRMRVYQNGRTSFSTAVDIATTPAVNIVNTWSTNADGYILSAGDSSNTFFRLYNDGYLKLDTTATSTHPVLELAQNTSTLPFIDYQGQEAATQTASITSVVGDGTNVVGPNDKNTTAGWQFFRMVKANINGTDCYVCTYEPAP